MKKFSTELQGKNFLQEACTNIDELQELLTIAKVKIMSCGVSFMLIFAVGHNKSAGECQALQPLENHRR